MAFPHRVTNCRLHYVFDTDLVQPPRFVAHAVGKGDASHSNQHDSGTGVVLRNATAIIDGQYLDSLSPIHVFHDRRFFGCNSIMERGKRMTGRGECES